MSQTEKALWAIPVRGSPVRTAPRARAGDRRGGRAAGRPKGSPSAAPAMANLCGGPGSACRAGRPHTPMDVAYVTDQRFFRIRGEWYTTASFRLEHVARALDVGRWTFWGRL